MTFPVQLQYGDYGREEKSQQFYTDRPSPGEADPEVKLRSGQNTYNVKVMMWLTGTNTDEKPEVKTVFRLN